MHNNENLILLDTNVLLFIAKLDSNEKIDYKVLCDFLKNKSVCISYITFFEILNREATKDKYSLIIKNLLKIVDKIWFIGTPGLNEHCDRKSLIFLEEKTLQEQEKSYAKIANHIIVLFSSFYSLLYGAIPTIMLMIFLNFEDKNKDLNFTEMHYRNFIQENYDNLCFAIYDFLKNKFIDLIELNSFTEKNRNIVFSNLYAELVKEYAYPFNAAFVRIDNGNFSFSNIAKNSQKALQRFKKSVVITSEKNRIPFPDISLYHAFIKSSSDRERDFKKYLTEIIAGFCKDDFGSEYMNALFQRSLEHLVFDNTTLKSNDYLDALLVCSVLDLDNPTRHIKRFISFDSKFVNMVRTFSQSYNLDVFINEKPPSGEHYIKG